jgi:hypothetical protein
MSVALALTWNAPAECPTTAEVIAQVEARLGGSTAAIPVVATGTVTHLDGESWQVVLVTDQAGTTGERRLAGPTCATVTSAAALVLALTIDPQALSRAARPPPPAPPPPPPPKLATHTVPAKPLFVRLMPTVGFGVGPNPASIGAELGFGAVVGRLSIEVVVAAFVPESYDSPRPGIGGTFSLATVGGALCGALVDGHTVRFGGCAGMEVQGMHGTGYGIGHPETGVAGWGAPTVATFLGVRLASDVWLASRIEGSLALDRPTFLIQGIGPVFHVNPVSGRAAVGIEIRF